MRTQNVQSPQAASDTPEPTTSVVQTPIANNSYPSTPQIGDHNISHVYQHNVLSKGSPMMLSLRSMPSMILASTGKTLPSLSKSKTLPSILGDDDFQDDDFEDDEILAASFAMPTPKTFSSTLYDGLQRDDNPFESPVTRPGPISTVEQSLTSNGYEVVEPASIGGKSCTSSK